MKPTKEMLTSMRVLLTNIDGNCRGNRVYLWALLSDIFKFPEKEFRPDGTKILGIGPRANKFLASLTADVVLLCDQNIQFFTDRKADLRKIAKQLDKNNPEEGVDDQG